MIPCTRLYAYIGCQLRAAALAAPSVIRARGPYASWIKEYSSDAFLELPASKEALLDKLGLEVPYSEYDCPLFAVVAFKTHHKCTNVMCKSPIANCRVVVLLKLTFSM